MRENPLPREDRSRGTGRLPKKGPPNAHREVARTGPAPSRAKSPRSGRAAWRMSWIRCVAWAGVSLAVLPPISSVQALQLPGVTPPTLPGVDRKFEVRFSNDFLGRGGEFDDFRTQQIGFVVAVASRWNLTVDHSILTLEDRNAPAQERIDHFSVSTGYSLARIRRSEHIQGLEVGAGLRYSGEFGGARMQNGFHQIVGSDPTTVPYTGTDRLDGTLWLRLPGHGAFLTDARLPFLGGDWRLGYWVRAATLVTTDSEWDGSVAWSAVASRRWFQAWLGIRGDWRNGHHRDRVTRETAAFEEGAGLVFGFRVGPMHLESVQHFDGKAAFGHFSLISSGRPFPSLPPGPHAFSLQAGLSIPDVLATFQGRWSDCRILRCSDEWRRTVLLDVRLGKPQFRDETEWYAVTRQVSAALELEGAPVPGHEWVAVFGALGGGWRAERLEGEGNDAGGLRSDPVERGGVVGDWGLRFGTSAARPSLSLMLQVGLSGWLPLSGGTVEFAGGRERLQRPQLVFLSGVVVQFAPGGS